MLAADTVVVIDELILGKPASAAEGVAMLERLAGRAHAVLTAVALAANDGLAFRLSASEVRFRALSRAECRAYWDTGEPHDKAGGYAVQGRGAVFIESLNGSYSGVMGLPLYETAELLRAAGVPYWLGGAPRGKTAVSTEILVNVAPRETRAAMLDNGVVQEIHIERPSRRGLVSNLYKGRVSRVLPGMQAAFVEIGLERTAFLHAADIAGTRRRTTPCSVRTAAMLTPVEDIRRLVNAGDESWCRLSRIRSVPRARD